MVNNAINQLKKNKQLFEKIDIQTAEKESIWVINTEMESRELMEEIQKLPVGFKAVFNLYAIEGYNHKEISEMLNIAESTSRSQFTRARAMLMKRLNNNSISFKNE